MTADVREEGAVDSGGPAASIVRKTPDEEHRLRAGEHGAELEVWRRVATITLPPGSLVALAAAALAERAQLRLPLDSREGSRRVGEGAADPGDAS